MEKMPEQVPQKQQENEKVVSPELAETIARLKEAGYLDTSFEGKETHELNMRALSIQEALEEYDNSHRADADDSWKDEGFVYNMPYSTPKAETLDVMIMNFNKNISCDEALSEMDRLGVRPLTYEELIQWGTAHPSHEDEGIIVVGLGSIPVLDYLPRVARLGFANGGISFPSATGYWGAGHRFPVVHK